MERETAVDLKKFQDPRGGMRSRHILSTDVTTKCKVAQFGGGRRRDGGI